MRPLIITAHYDDMEVSAGGTCAKYKAPTFVLTPKEEGAYRDEWLEARAALGIFHGGFDSFSRLSDREIVNGITSFWHGHDTIITTNPWDSHPDHQHAASIGQQVARKRGMNLLYMDHAIPGGYDGTSPKPNFFVPINGVKYDALKCYKSQIQKYGPEWIQTIEARDKSNGWTHNTRWAEGFIVADWTLG